jgi:hypothetical protein
MAVTVYGAPAGMEVTIMANTEKSKSQYSLASLLAIIGLVGALAVVLFPTVCGGRQSAGISPSERQDMEPVDRVEMLREMFPGRTIAPDKKNVIFLHRRQPNGQPGGLSRRLLQALLT